MVHPVTRNFYIHFSDKVMLQNGAFQMLSQSLQFRFDNSAIFEEQYPNKKRKIKHLNETTGVLPLESTLRTNRYNMILPKVELK